MKYSVAIIGGGFSGMCAGVKLGAVLGSKLLILEGNKRVGKKIIATGNGQGNITNTLMSEKYYHGDVNLVKTALDRYSNTHLISFFEELGLITDVHNGKVYPASFVAGSITDVLRFELERLNVSVKTECYVTKIVKEGGFKITCENGEVYFAEKVICAFGGKSGAGFLTDGRSYKLLTNLNHTLTELSPSLVQLKCEKEKIKGLKGIKLDAKVGLYGDKRHIATFNGDILFTDYGISGNAVFSLSAYLKGVKNPTVEIEFLPNFTREFLAEKLSVKCKNKMEWEKLLVSFLPSRLALSVLKVCSISHAEIAKQHEIEKVVNCIKSFTLKIEGTSSFDNSQVTAGGINTKEIHYSSLESKIVPNLYIIGETLDVDGDCGGYNLQWAFTSAMIASEDILSEES
ncbi:MAG: aminoacetone oxidase family FAD-binding enzyme [Clostridia bacterium]|nr:aminoacetone oxidase family FAD-binding enzyme [Clostridia bacterium]